MSQNFLIEVQKYGGTSVGDLEKIAKVAKHLKGCLPETTDASELKKKIVVVVSAMDKTTNFLIAQARELTAEPNLRELDQLLQIGETQSAALLAMKLIELGVKAKSFTALQIGLQTSDRYGNAAILGLRDKGLIFRLLEQLDVVVVTGFQGIVPGEIAEITTVGRGGSDAIAVALAVELDAACTIYTDVDGVYAVDPRVVGNAKRFKIITPNQMIKMFKAGAGVMMGRSVEIAQRFNKPIQVKLSPSFGLSDGGTEIKNSPANGVEYPEYRELIGLGIKKIGTVTIYGLPNVPGIAYRLLRGVEANILELIQPLARSQEDAATLTILLQREDVATVADKMDKAIIKDKHFSSMTIYRHEDLMSLTLVDPIMVDSSGYIEKMLSTLARKTINIESIFSAEDKLGVVVKEDVHKKAAQALAIEFELINESETEE